MTLRWKRRLVLTGLVLAAVGAGVGVWWVRGVRLERVEVVGVREARPAEVARLARVRPGERLVGVSPALVEDRVRRHPWVARAEATRLPAGVLRIAVRERRPVALVVDGRGEGLAYLAADGHAMPVATPTPYDVPLVHGLDLPTNLTRPVASASVRELAAALATLGPAADALVSDFAVDRRGDVTLTTVAPPGGEALRVRLGRDGHGEKLDRLARFWHQAVLTRPGHRYASLDFRFAGQIVTREAEAGRPFPDARRPAPALSAPDSARAAAPAAQPAPRDSSRT